MGSGWSSHSDQVNFWRIWISANILPTTVIIEIWPGNIQDDQTDVGTIKSVLLPCSRIPALATPFPTILVTTGLKLSHMTAPIAYLLIMGVVECPHKGVLSYTIFTLKYCAVFTPKALTSDRSIKNF